MKNILRFITLSTFLLTVSILNAQLVENDTCESAIELTDLEGGCYAYPTDSASFDSFNGSCATNPTGPNIWFKFTPQAPTADITVNTTGVSFSVIQTPTGDCNLNGSREIGCKVAPGTMTVPNLIVGNTYYILVTNNSNTTDSTRICIDNPIPPPNDHPCDPDPLPNGGCVSGTTNGATSDFYVPGCQANMENTVFYEITLQPNTDTLKLNFGNNDITGDVGIGLITFPFGCNGTPSLVTNNSYYCGPIQPDITFYGLTGGETIYIILGTSRENSGDFEDLCVSEFEGPPACANNGTCQDAEDVPMPDLAVSYCVDGCNENMPDGPSISGGGACSNMQHPVAWYHITTGPSTNTLVFDFNSDDLTSPLYAVFSDCNTMVQCNPVVMDCFSNTDYWIAVTDANGAEGDFQLCMAQLYRTDPCITSQELKVVSASLGSDIKGPFKPCEEIRFQYTTNFIKLGQQWIHSVFPVISDCFDYNPGDEPAPATYPTTGANWGWHPAGTVYWKSVDNTSGLVGINGTRLCVIGTNGCSPFTGGGNCSTSGTSMPAGWIGWTSGSNCTNSGSDPNLKYGDPANGPFVFTFTLKIPCDACTDTTCTKYTVGITGFSDGQTGGWESASCNGHTLVSQKVTVKCCIPPTMTIVNGETCSDKVFFGDITLDPQNSTIRWTVENANGVTGATGGSGSTFSQTLHNPTNSTKTVRYKIIAVGPDGCESDPQYLDVNVFPAVIANAGPDKISCPGATVTLGGTPPGSGGDGGPYSFEWSNGETTPTISVTPSITTVYTLTVTDGSGCTGTDEVRVTVNASIVVNITPQPAEFCLSDLAGKTLTANSNATNNPITYKWTTPWGDRFDKTIPIEANAPGTYQVTVEVTDGVGCRGIGTARIVINPGPVVEITVAPDGDLCEGDQFQLSSTPAAWEGTVFRSVPPGAVTPDGLINTLNMTQFLDYTIYAEFTDANGCKGYDSIIVRSIHIDDPVIEPAGPFCANEETPYQLIATPAGGVFSGPGVSGEGVFIPYSLGGAGTYQITYTVGTQTCNKSTTTDIVINPIPTPQILPPTEFCDNETPDPILTGLPLGGTWSGSSIIDQNGTIDLSNTVPGLYNVTYTVTELGCTDSISTQILISSQPDATVIPNGTVCNDGLLDPNRPIVDFSTYITGGDGTGYWTELDPKSGAQNTAGSVWDFTGVPDGTVATFRYTLTAVAPCTDFTADVTITVNDDCACPKINISQVPDKCNDNAFVDLSSLINDSAPGTWSLVSGPDLTVLTGTIFDATGKAAGSYRLRYTLNPAPSEPLCPAFFEIVIVVQAKVVLNMLPQLNICTSSPTDYKTKLDMKKFFVGNIVPGSWTNIDNVGNALTNDTIDFRGVPAGMYKFRYITNNAVSPCLNDTVDVIVNVTLDCNCPTLTVIKPNEKLCNSGGTQDLSLMINSDKTGDWTLISDPSGPVNIPVSNLFDATGKTPGTYTFQFEINEPIPSDCDSILKISIDVNPEVKIDLVDQLKVCNQSPTPAKTQIDLSKFFGGQSVPSGNWTNNDNVGTVISGTLYDFAGVPAGTYTFTYTTNTAIAPCTDATETVTLIVTDECNCPDLNLLRPNQKLCNDNGTTDLANAVSSSVPGKWTQTKDPSGNTNIPLATTIFTATGKTAGTYEFTYKIDNVPSDCDSVLVVTIDVIQELIYQLQPLVTVCNSDPAGTDADILDINSNKVWSSSVVSGSWNPGTSGAVDMGGGRWNFNGVPVGNYTFTFTPNSAQTPCPNVPQTITIEVTDKCDCPDLPAVTQLNPLCNNSQDFTLVVPTGASGTWSVISPLGPGYATITNNIFNIQGKTGGTYKLLFTYDNVPAGCPNTATIDVVLSEYYFAGNAAQTFEYCEKTRQLLDLNDEITGEDVGGIWSDVKGNAGAAFNTTTAILRIQDLAPGDYIFNYRFNQNGACPGSSVDVNVHICPIPEADAGVDQKLTCQDKEATIGVSASTGSNFEYSWVDIKNNNPIANPTQLVNTVTLPGIYVLTVRDKECGCIKTDTVNIVADGIPERVDITAVGPSCYNYTNGYIRIDQVVGGNQPFQFEFNGGTASPNTSWTNLGAGTYTITMIDATGCRIELKTTFTNPKQLTVDLGNDTIIHIGDTVLIDPVISIPDSSIATITYSSDYDFINCTDCFEINVFPNQTTTYTVEVKDKNGCSDSDDKRIIVKKGVNIWVPNIFTPDGDGNNDRVIVSTNTKEIKRIVSFQIYDRWGEQVFQAFDFPPNDQNSGWDGKLRGQPLPPAVFGYWLEVELFDGTREIVKGDITLIR